MDRYHLTKEGGRWKLTKRGGERASKTFGTKAEAVKGSAEFVKKRQGSLVIHTADGAIQEERTYPPGADPRAS